MFGTIVAKLGIAKLGIAKLSEICGIAPRAMAVVIPLDRPDLMADAGFDGLRYQGAGSRGRVRSDWLAVSWMPFQAAVRQ